MKISYGHEDELIYSEEGINFTKYHNFEMESPSPKKWKTNEDDGDESEEEWKRHSLISSNNKNEVPEGQS